MGLLKRAVAWLIGRIFLSRNRHNPNSPYAIRRRMVARRRPPAIRIDFSDQRNPLTRPPSPRTEAETAPNSARPCLLLDALPLEIRRLIWVEILGGYNWHLNIQLSVLKADLCASLSPTTCHSQDCRRQPSYQRMQQEKRFLLSIVLCCKQTYSEGINYLYSANTFIIYTDVIEHLPTLFLPQRIDAIRSLTFYWYFLFSPEDVLHQDAEEKMDPNNIDILASWVDTWKKISAMRGLETLNVKMVSFPHFWRDLNKETAAELLDPIREVVRLKSFILSLPFAARVSSQPEINFPWAASADWDGIDPWDDLPCTISRVSVWTDL